MSEVTVFVRKASGLVRSWSMFDAFIYATFSINLITLGLYIFSYCYYFEGNLATAVVVGGASDDLRGAGLCQPDLRHATRRRRLRLAKPHPRASDRLYPGCHRLVVHPLAVGAALLADADLRSIYAHCWQS